MVKIEAEDKQHQRIVQRFVNQAIKQGRKPENISISGSQNPALERWAKRKGVIFDPEQEVDIFEATGD